METCRTLEWVAMFLRDYLDNCGAKPPHGERRSDDSHSEYDGPPSIDLDGSLDTASLHAPIFRGRTAYLSPSNSPVSYSGLASPFSPKDSSRDPSIYSFEKPTPRSKLTPQSPEIKSRFAEYFEQENEDWNDIQKDLAPIYTGVSPCSSFYSSDEEFKDPAREQQRIKSLSEKLQAFTLEAPPSKNIKGSRLKRIWVPSLKLNPPFTPTKAPARAPQLKQWDTLKLNLQKGTPILKRGYEGQPEAPAKKEGSTTERTSNILDPGSNRRRRWRSKRKRKGPLTNQNSTSTGSEDAE